jgi:hypothetical protein
MNPGFPPVMTPAATSMSTGVTHGVTHGPPQYAEFDVSKKSAPVHEDALPAMPSWENAGSKKVLVDEEAVEMDQLKKPEASGQNAALMAGATGGVSAQSTPATSPGPKRSPYGPPTGNPGANGYFPATSSVEADPYAANGQGYSQQGTSAYGGQQGMGVDQGYGMAGAALGQGRRSPQAAFDNNGYGDAGYGQGRNSPQAAYDNNGYGDAGYGQGRGYGQPARQATLDSNYGAGRQAGYNNYGDNNYGALGSQGYGSGRRQSPPNELAGDSSYGQSAGYGQEPVRRSPAPQGDYGYGNSNSGNNNGGYGGQPYPSDQYDVAQTSNNGGFDFGASAYSRPTPPPSGGYRQPSPVQPQQSGGYPGYKPYQPAGSQQQGGGW